MTTSLSNAVRVTRTLNESRPATWPLEYYYHIAMDFDGCQLTWIIEDETQAAMIADELRSPSCQAINNAVAVRDRIVALGYTARLWYTGP